MSERARKRSRSASFFRRVAALSPRCTDPLHDSLAALSAPSSSAPLLRRPPPTSPPHPTPGAARNVIQKHNARYRLSHGAALSSPDTGAVPVSPRTSASHFYFLFFLKVWMFFPQACTDICFVDACGESTHTHTYTSLRRLRARLSSAFN